MAGKAQAPKVRASSRIKGKETTVTYADPDSSGEENPAEAPAAGSKRKRKTKPKAEPADSKTGGNAVASSSTKKEEATVDRPVKRRRGKRGLLEQLVEMPMDLLFEIFGKLNPNDLLSLSRTTKALRQVMMSKSAAIIWRESLASDPTLPPCPDDLNEPSWADLVYGKNCMVCNRTVSQQACKVIWEARLRACSRCLIPQLSDYSHGMSHGLPYAVYELLPRHKVNQGRYYSRNKVFDTMRVEWVKEYTQCTTEEEKERWATEKKEEFTKRREHAALCNKWAQRQAEIRMNHAEDVRTGRENFILDKLAELGFEAEVEDWRERRDIWSEPVLSQLLKKNISERVWASAEEKVVVAAQRLSEERTNRLNRESVRARHQQFAQFHKAVTLKYPIAETLIPAAELFMTDEVQLLLSEIPIADEITAEDFQPIEDAFKDISDRWVLKAKQKLLEKVADKVKEVLAVSEVTLDALDLAFITFRCGSSMCYYNSPMMDWRVALRHTCNRWVSGAGIEDVQLRAFATDTQQMPWGMDIKLDAERSKRMVELFQHLRYDLKTATMAKLDALDDILECQSCFSNTQGRLLLDWNSAVDHPCKNQLVKVDAETAKAARIRMAEDLVRIRACSTYKGLGCNHCRYEANGSGMRKHLVEEHSIDPPTNDDVTELPHCPRRATLRYWKLNREGPMTCF